MTIRKRGVSKMSLREVRNTDQLCRLCRDHYQFGDWSILTDGYRVYLSKQKMGHPRTEHIELPKSVFDKMFDCYGRKTSIGHWADEKFYPREAKK